MKFLTFNIHKGFNWSNQKFTLQMFKQQLKELQPDLVFLQEVVGEDLKLSTTNEDWIENQFEYLADELWNDFAYAKNAVYDKRHHGNVILSRFPIKRKEVINISTNPLEKRGVLFCEIEHDSELIHCYCVHLNLTHRGRLKQYDLIQKLILEYSSNQEKVILAGDFNDWNQRASHKLTEIKEAHKEIHGDYAKTYPASFPLLKLDRLYLRQIVPVNVKVLNDEPWNKISDHLPLWAEFKI